MARGVGGARERDAQDIGGVSAMSDETPLRVSEIFGPTIQGEGALIGVPTVFVRLGGCDYRCSWCDSLHAVDSAYRESWTPMSAEAVMEAVAPVGRAALAGVAVGREPGDPALGRADRHGPREGLLLCAGN